MAHPRTTILHISDLHFGEHHGFNVTAGDIYDQGVGSLLEHLSADLDRIDCNPDLLVASGDLTTLASNDEFAEAKSFLVGLLERHKLGKDRLVVVPGNHDVVWLPERNSRATLSEYQSFASRLYGTPVQNDEVRFASHGDVFILGLDATRLENPSTGGIGFIGRDQLSRASEILNLHATDKVFRVLVLHHHLLPVAWVGDRPENGPEITTLDAPSILAWAQEHRFALILHGHQHQSFLCAFHFPTRTNGPLLVAGAPSIGGKRECLPPSGRNGFQIIVLDGSELQVETRLITESREFEQHVKTNFVQHNGRVYAKAAIPGGLGFKEPVLEEGRLESIHAIERMLRLLALSYGPTGGLRSISARIDHARDGQRLLESVGLPSSPAQRHVVQSIRSLTQTVSANIGDGRKTAAILALTMADAGIKAVLDGQNDAEIAAAILNTANAASDMIRTQLAKPVRAKEQLQRIACTAMGGNDDFARLIADAFESVGKDGLVVIREGELSTSKSVELTVEDKAQFKIRRPDWLRNLFPQNPELTDSLVFSVADKLDASTLVAVLEHAKKVNRSILIACEDLEEVAEEIVVKNVREGIVNAVVVHLHGYGEQRLEEYRDLMTVTDGEMFYVSNSNIESTTFGSSTFVCLDQDQLLVARTAGDKGNLRRERYLTELRDHFDKEESSYRKDMLQERLARIGGAVATITVSGTSETDLRIRKGLVEDGFFSASRAIESGFIPGGGASPFKCAESLYSGQPNIAVGSQAVLEALRMPLITLARGCSTDPEAIGDNLILRPDCAFDAVKRQIVEAENGPIDPASVAADVIVYAAEVASRLVRTRSWDTSSVVADEQSMQSNAET